jgi:hypothetical protein
MKPMIAVSAGRLKGQLPPARHIRWAGMFIGGLHAGPAGALYVRSILLLTTRSSSKTPQWIFSERPMSGRSRFSG